MSTIKNMLKNKIKINELFDTKIMLVFLLALVLRLLFVYQDYPFVFHPDEPTVVNSTINLRYDPNPKHFDWPTFYYYFTYPFFWVFEKVYFLLHDFGIVKSIVIESINYYLLSRIITTVFGAATVILVYKILLNLKVRDSYALLGACIMAVIPFHVTRSAQALTDVPMVFFCALSIYLLSKNLEEFNLKYFVLSLFFAGLAVSTKYNAYMIFLTHLIYVFYLQGFSFKDFKNYLLGGFAAFLGFFIGTPYFIFDYQTFFISDSPKGALWQFQNVGKVTLDVQFQNFYKNLFINNYDLMGYIPVVLSLTFIVYIFFKKEFLKKDNYSKFILILIFQFIFIFWSVSGVRIQRAHYLMLVYMFLPIFTILLLDRIEKFKLSVLAYLLNIFMSSYSLYNRIDVVPLVQFYDRLSITGDKSKFLVLYNNSEIKMVLDKLKLPNHKINNSSSKIPPKTSHLVINFDFCKGSTSCSFELIDKLESRSDSEVIYVFKKK